MVSVPRYLAEQAMLAFFEAGYGIPHDALRTILAQPGAQHQGAPLGWVHGGGQEFTACPDHAHDLRAEGVELTAAYAHVQHQGEPVAAIPDGYCLMPRRLTAENGAKALLLGEFKLEVTRECPECIDLEEPAEGCEICDGEGEYAQRHTIPWEQIKFIYSKAVKGLALQPSPSCSEKLRQ